MHCSKSLMLGSLIHVNFFFYASVYWNLIFTLPGVVSENDQEIPQSQTADKTVAPRGRDTQQSRDHRKTNKAKQPALSLSHHDDYKTSIGHEVTQTKHGAIAESHNWSNNQQ